MRMARVNITVPDEVLSAARNAGLTISTVATEGLRRELERLSKADSVHRYLAELDAELGPSTAEEIERAQRWADAAFGSIDAERSSA